jgi:hypothetical protein
MDRELKSSFKGNAGFEMIGIGIGIGVENKV